MTETPEVKARRAAHERALERVGVGSEAGQALLTKWASENRRAQKATK